MTTLPTTSWLKLSNHSKGLDPLGAQAPSINIYGQLLPGITNVTDRARYYSFYPWMIRTFENLPGEKTYEGIKDWVRRCDCLFSMIGIRHGLVADDNNYLLHARALIGSNTLHNVVLELENGGIAHLPDFINTEDSNPLRYFKNPLGGLQQYYIGTFDGLGLMTHKGRYVANTNEGGIPLAEKLDDSVDHGLFIKTVNSGKITADILDALASFCPCQLKESRAEHSALLDLFFARNNFDDELGQQRRNTLGLMLDLVRILENNRVQFDQNIFRSCVYTGTLPDGTSWNLPSKLEFSRKQWRTYQRHELLSAAVQSFFWVGLKKISDTQKQLWSTQEFVKWFAEESEVQYAAEILNGSNFKNVKKMYQEKIPDLRDWQDGNHELQLARQVLTHCNDKMTPDYAKVLEQAGRILLAVTIRDTEDNPAYDPLDFPTGFFMLYPLNLETLRHLSRETWLNMPVHVWLAWVAGYWGIEAHLRVALRKLRFQNKETLHVMPTDRGFIVQEFPSPTYTTPRFTQGIQILEDLGAILRTPSNESMELTSLGNSLWRETNA